jgi:hypothetical protein
MSKLVALSVSIGVLGAVATFICLSVPGLLIWAAFIAWACFFHTGGTTGALRTTIVCNIFGAVTAWVAALILLHVPAGPVWASIVVGLTVLVMCLGAHVAAFSTIPASVYGYAATFAFLLQTPDMLKHDKLMSATFQNALVAVAVSMVIGAVFGWLSGKMAAALTSPSPAASRV